MVCAALPAANLRYWVEPCSQPASGCHAPDPELAQWAMEAWQAASGGHLTFEKTADRDKAHIRIFWTGGRDVDGQNCQKGGCQQERQSFHLLTRLIFNLIITNHRAIQGKCWGDFKSRYLPKPSLRVISTFCASQNFRPQQIILCSHGFFPFAFAGLRFE
jgi:hypothetical protein